MDANKPGVQPIHALTSLRFVSAIWVVLHHFGAPFVPESWRIGRKLLETGGTGVTFFFVLSGFILAVNYPVSRLRTKSYLLARFARVYPLYALGAILAFPFYLSGQLDAGWLVTIREVATQGFLCATLLQAWFPDRAIALNPASWSLSAEAFFYVALIPALRWSTARRFLDRTGLALVVLWLLGMAAPLWWILAHPGMVPSMSLVGWDAWTINVVSFNPLVRIPEFLMGVALGRAHLRGARLPRPGWVAGGCTVAILAMVLLTEPHWGPFVHSGLPTLFFALLIFGLAQARGRFIDLVSRPLPIFLGEASYALYILHVPIFLWMRMASTRTGIETTGIAWRVVYFTLAISLSCAAFHWIESPARRSIRAWSDRGRSPRPEDQPQRASAGART